MRGMAPTEQETRRMRERYESAGVVLQAICPWCCVSSGFVLLVPCRPVICIFQPAD